eukprot:354846-Chlamydomonas_euryale.AAC.5
MSALLTLQSYVRLSPSVPTVSLHDLWIETFAGQAGYAPPPPGSRGSYHYTKAYYQAHGMDSGGPVKVGGPFGGYATEFEFYRCGLTAVTHANAAMHATIVRQRRMTLMTLVRLCRCRAMYRTNRNNPAMLLMVGLFAIPVVTMVTSVLNGNTGFIRQFRDEGIYMFTQGRYRVNGRDTLMNPFSIRSLDNMVRHSICRASLCLTALAVHLLGIWARQTLNPPAHYPSSFRITVPGLLACMQEDSYIYKSDKYKHLRTNNSQSAPAQDGLLRD